VATATLLQDELVPFGAHHYCILAFAEKSILLQASSCKLTFLANFELNFLLALLADSFESRSLTENLDPRLSTSVSQWWPVLLAPVSWIRAALQHSTVRLYS
jgi:hypothetical protein